MLSDRKKIEEKALSILRNLHAFKDFMNKNSELSSMFRLPGLMGEVQRLTPAPWLLCRDYKQGRRCPSRSCNNWAAVRTTHRLLLQQNLQAAQGQLSALKAQIPMSFGNGSSEMEVPDFKPNSQKTKSFKDRLEYGANTQSQRSTRFLPTSDIDKIVKFH